MKTAGKMVSWSCFYFHLARDYAAVGPMPAVESRVPEHTRISGIHLQVSGGSHAWLRFSVAEIHPQCMPKRVA
jgi:hypothetical protein